MAILTTVMEIAGAACIAVAGFLIMPAVGFALTGCALIGFGWLMGRDV